MSRKRVLLTLVAISFAASLPAVAAEQNPEGFIYGTVETRSGNRYTGTIRWSDEEAFWDDLFNSGKDENDYERFVDRRDRERGRAIKVFGFTIGYQWDDDDFSHQFVARFGDISAIEIRGRRQADVIMKNGERYPVEGVANDVGATIFVNDESLGEIEIDWDRIERISFAPTPTDLRPEVFRIHGTVETDVGTFEGFVQWDSEECLSTDRLDGETRDGDLSIEMGRIKAIEKRNRNGAWVELADGRRLLLEDTNDVDHSIDGIMVEDDRYGRVRIGWDSFERVDFEEVTSSGAGYDFYKPAKPITGAVVTRGGDRYQGRIVYDIDEAESWEFLNGKRFDVEYYIPFDRIRSITPLGAGGSKVVLADGTELELDDSNDVDDDNDGILVFTREGADPEYVRWEDVDRLELD